MLSLSSEIKEMSNSSNTSSCLLEKESVDNECTNKSSVTSIHLVQFDESFKTNEDDQLKKEKYTDKIITPCCYGEENGVTNF